MPYNLQGLPPLLPLSLSPPNSITSGYTAPANTIPHPPTSPSPPLPVYPEVHNTHAAVRSHAVPKVAASLLLHPMPTHKVIAMLNSRLCLLQWLLICR